MCRFPADARFSMAATHRAPVHALLFFGLSLLPGLSLTCLAQEGAGPVRSQEPTGERVSRADQEPQNWMTFSGREAADQLGGPIRIAQVSGQVATAGFVALIHLTAVLSVSIGLLNLFPIPLLDGGHLLF